MVWIVALINSFNMLDNMDGLSAGIGTISASVLAAVLLLAQVLRYWAVRTLGDRWTTRVVCVPGDPLVVTGDFNVAPEDRDVWDIAAFNLSTHVTGPERDALARLRAWGLTDAFRAVDDEANGFSFWDFRNGDFHQGRGMRIDLAYVTAPVAERLTAARVDRDARKGEKPSDHAPVVFDLRD